MTAFPRSTLGLTMLLRAGLITLQSLIQIAAFQKSARRMQALSRNAASVPLQRLISASIRYAALVGQHSTVLVIARSMIGKRNTRPSAKNLRPRPSSLQES